MDREVVDLYLDDIIPNRFQPREVFNEQALKELSDSIKAHGVIQPIIVRKIGDKYEIIAGERRYKASAMAGLTKIPAIIRNLDDKETSKVALLENLQRKDLTPIEEARTYQKILELDSMTQEELGRTMGKSQAAIANKMRLLSLPDEVQEALLKDQISERHARSLLNLDTSQEQINMLHDIINNRMTVRELDNAIKRIKGENVEVPLSDNSSIISNNSETKSIIEVSDPENNDFMFDLSSAVDSKEEDKNIELKIDTRMKELPDELNQILSSPISGNINPVNEEKSSIPSPFDKKEYTIEELLDDDELYSLKDAIAEIRNSLKIVEEKGFLVKMEEMDFESTYQIIIKIDKNN